MTARLIQEERGDYNVRYAVHLADGATVEAVRYRGDTLCVSSQVGCAVGCPFCASGANGLMRALTLDELQSQVTEAERDAGTLARVTLSGVGEPLHNHANAVAFVRWCRERGTPASVTTSGGPLPRLREWLVDVPHNGITISTHAGTESVREQMVPQGPALDPLFALLSEVSPAISRKRRKKVALAYLMIADQNNSPAELMAFADRVLAIPNKRDIAVHLYAYNPVATSACEAVPRAEYEAAYELLRERGLMVRMSSQARLEANGGCGTLVAARLVR